MNHRLIRVSVRQLERVIGRSRLVKLARLTTNEVRLDVENSMATNGETNIQRLALTAQAPVVFDVGAHFGEWSASLLAQPGSQPLLHAFEPSAVTAANARKVLSSRATVHQCAVSDRAGMMDLQIVHEGAGSNSLVPFTDTDRASGETEIVEVSTVDQIAADLGLDRITLLKIDAEGHDLPVIYGARGLLERRAIDLVQFEYNCRWIDSRLFLLDAFLELESHGYSLGKITPRGVEAYPDGWHPELEKYVEGNYLAWLPDWADKISTISWWGP